MIFKKKHNTALEHTDRFLDTLDRCLLVFKEGVKDYLYTNTEAFAHNLQEIAGLEEDAADLRRAVEADLYSQAALVRFRADIMRLLETMDHIVDSMNESLFQFEIEMPFVPSELNTDFIKLTELSTQAVACVIPAAKAYFTAPDIITEKIHRVYYFEKETNKQAQAIKRKVFHDMPALKLSEKFHLRYFALHIENLSDAAEKAADQLSVMSIKRSI